MFTDLTLLLTLTSYSTIHLLAWCYGVILPL